MSSMQDEYYDRAFDELMKAEGGYVNDPADLGGETKYGISKRSYPNLDIKNITLDQAKAIYYEDFWLKNKCNVIYGYGLAEKLFSISVNMGCKQAGILLQRALRTLGVKLTEDGVIGPMTTAAMLRVDYASLLAALKSEAAGYYRLIANSIPSQNKFLLGWLNRAYA
jgi:lysozyme family protein